MSFLTKFAQYGTLSTKVAAAKEKQPLHIAFSKQVSRQIDFLQGHTEVLKPRAVWSKVNADGTVTMALKNGVVSLPLDGDKTLITLPNVKKAVEFLHDVLQAVTGGEFNDLLQATKPPARKRGQEVL